MHPEALEFVARFCTKAEVTLLDLGGRDLNGSGRRCFPNAIATVIDQYEADDVDIVTDAATWVPDTTYDVVLCTEVFEHTPDWPFICGTAHKALRDGGLFIATMAGPGREPHSGIDGGAVRAGEHYCNVTSEALEAVLVGLGFTQVKVDVLGHDVRCSARK